MLLSNTPIAEREEKIFELVNQFNIALDFITHQPKRDHLAEMNLTAGRKALASTAYSSALKYLKIGIELLADDSWDKKYDLTLVLYETAAEAAYLAGEFEQMEQIVQIVLAQAKTILEKVKVYEVIIKASGAQNKLIEAVNTALKILYLLGLDIPKNPSQLEIQSEIEKTSANLFQLSSDEIINLPEMTDNEPLAIMRILGSTIPVAYQAVPNLFPVIILKQINLSLKHGNAPLSAYAYITYGMLLCGTFGDIDSGYKFGQLAKNLVAKLNVKEVKAKVIFTMNATLRCWKEHIKQ